MKLEHLSWRAGKEHKADLRTALWVSFWLYITQKGDPDLLDQMITFLGRLLGGGA